MLLDGLRVLELTSEIAGPYAGKLLVDAGADVVKVEHASGDPLRGWSASHSSVVGDGLLFRFLNASKRSVVAAPGDESFVALVDGADVVIEDGRLADDELAAVLDRGVPVVSITPFGRQGPYADHPATEFTLQAMCGSTGGRGPAGGEPLHAGGRLGEWAAGVYAAVAGLAATRSTRGADRPEHADVSIFECMCVALGGFDAIRAAISGVVPAGMPRNIDTPSVEPTADGLVGFTTLTGQQLQDFLLLVGHPELRGDPRFVTVDDRLAHRDEFCELVWAWTTQHPTAEVIERAIELRIPVTPIGDPGTITGIDHFVARGIFGPSADGSFVQPRPPFRVSGVEPRPAGPAPVLGADTGTVRWDRRPRAGDGAPTARSTGCGSSTSPPSGRGRRRPRRWLRSGPT